MKLEGSLDAFSLPDIFQLLSFTKKSGGLHLRRAAIHGCVYFRDGSVTGATSDVCGASGVAGAADSAGTVRFWTACQIRVTAVLRSLNFFTGSFPGRLFQISTSLAAGHSPATASRSKRTIGQQQSAGVAFLQHAGEDESATC